MLSESESRGWVKNPRAAECEVRLTLFVTVTSVHADGAQFAGVHR